MNQQLLYILGHPIGHSKSPAMYNALYGAANLLWEYGSMDLPTEEEARAFLHKGTFLSINITTPYKPLALRFAAERDEASVLAGGANVLVNAGYLSGAGTGATHLRAYNVDGIGCISYLQHEGVDFAQSQRNCVICGTGPTALSILHAALKAGANVALLSRSANKAASILDAYKEKIAQLGTFTGEVIAGSYGENAHAISNANVIIDATSLGMQAGDPAPFDTALLHNNQVVFDTVYGHGETALISAARAAGAKALDGRGMLVAQAVETAKIVTAAAGVQLPFSTDQQFDIMAKAAGFDL